MTDVWVPVPLRWRHVQPGDVIVGTNGRLIAVEATGGHGQQVYVHLHGHALPFPLDPDDTVQVLVPVAERDALVASRDQLGARIAERRAG